MPGRTFAKAIRALSRDRSKDLASDILDQAQKRTREQQETLQQQRRQRL